MADIIKTYTLQDFIIQGEISSVMSYDKLLLKVKNSDGNIFPMYNLINDYYDELIISSVMIKMNDTEFKRYQFRPKLLSYDLYGSTELFFLILLLNSMSSIKQFNTNRVKVLRPDSIGKILSYIYGTEQDNITNNRTKINEPTTI